jgi:hypothetical protein
MQKLSLKSMVMLCESCRIAHSENNEVVLHFFNFSVILYDFSNIQQNPYTI